MAKILLVEDTLDHLQFYATFLRLDGHVVFTCEDGECAVQTVSEAKEEGMDFDLAMLDLAMPDKTGFEVMDEIREMGCQCPVVFITANSDPFSKATAHSKGAEIFSKPVDAEQIGQIVNLMLAGRK